MVQSKTIFQEMYHHCNQYQEAQILILIYNHESHVQDFLFHNLSVMICFFYLHTFHCLIFCMWTCPKIFWICCEENDRKKERERKREKREKERERERERERGRERKKEKKKREKGDRERRRSQIRVS